MAPDPMVRTRSHSYKTCDMCKISFMFKINKNSSNFPVTLPNIMDSPMQQRFDTERHLIRCLIKQKDFLLL